MAEDGSVLELMIRLNAETRSDGSVFVESPDLPLFTAIGRNQKEAHELVMKLLPEYLRLNVPDFVDIRSIKSATTRIISGKQEEHLLPAALIARAGDRRNAERETAADT